MRGAEVIYSTSSRKELAEPRLGPRAPALNHYAALSSWLCAIPSCSEKLTCDTAAAGWGGGWGGGGLRVPLGLCGWALQGAAGEGASRLLLPSGLGPWAKGDLGPLGDLATKGNQDWVHVTPWRP